MHDEDLVLVKLCLNHEPVACNTLINRYKTKIFSYIYRMVQNIADAEDIAQNTFIKVFQSLASYNSAYPLQAWIFKIAHNKAIDFLRAKQPEALSLNDDGNPIELEDKNASVEEHIAASSLHKKIEIVLNSLPVRYREILILRFQRDFSYNEIADITGLPIGTVKTYLFRGREIMRKKLRKIETS